MVRFDLEADALRPEFLLQLARFVEAHLEELFPTPEIRNAISIKAIEEGAW